MLPYSIFDNGCNDHNYASIATVMALAYNNNSRCNDTLLE